MGPAGDVVALVAVGVTVVYGSSDEVVIDISSILVVEPHQSLSAFEIYLKISDICTYLRSQN